MKNLFTIILAATTFFLNAVPALAVTVMSQDQLITPVGFGVVMSTSSAQNGKLTASSSPTVGYITATSTTASSTFGNGLNILNGCFAKNGVCVGPTGSGTPTEIAFWDSLNNLTSTSTLYWNNDVGALGIGDMLGDCGVENALVICATRPFKYLGIFVNYDPTGSSNFVWGNDAESASLLVGVGNSNDGQQSQFINTPYATGGFGNDFVLGANNSELIRLASTSKVGIGINNPLYVLDVYGVDTVFRAGNEAARIDFSNADSWPRLTGSQSGIDQWTVGITDLFDTDALSIYTAVNEPIIFGTNNTRHAVLNELGYFGVGTTSPGTPLGITGAGVFTGPVTATVFNATSTVASSTFANGLNITGGCFAVNGTCVGGSSVSGGTAGMLTSWTSATALTATSTPTATAYYATSTTATSTFLGGLYAGGNGANKLRVQQNGQVQVGKELGTSPFNVRVTGTLNATNTVMTLSADAVHSTADAGATVIDFNDNKSGSNEATYARFGMKVTDNNAGIERGAFSWSVANAPTLKERMVLTSEGNLLLSSTTPPSASIGLTANGYGYFTGGLGIGVYNSTPGSIRSSAGLTVGGTTDLSGALTSTSNSTSTFSQGLNILNGCFAFNSTCLGQGGGNNVVNYIGHQFDFAEDATISNALTRYLPAAGGTIATSDILRMTVTQTGTLKNLYAMGDANTLNNTTTVTVIKNGVDTTLVCTMAATVTSCNDTSSSISVTAGDHVSVKVVTTGTGTLTRPRASFQLVVSGSFGTQWTTLGNNIYYSSTTGVGNVGIGTTTPLAKLGVQGTTTSSTTKLFQVASSTEAVLFDINGAGHIGIGGATATVSSCGTGPSITGNDTVGTVTVGTGIVTSCTVTFAAPRATAPRVVGCTANSALACGATSKSTTAVTFGFSATLGGGTFDYMIIGQ